MVLIYTGQSSILYCIGFYFEMTEAGLGDWLVLVILWCSHYK